MRDSEQEVGDLLVLREAVLGPLREDESTVDRDLEDPAAALDQLDLDVGEGLPELGGQTDRLGAVVSLDAVLDRDVHGAPGKGRRRPF